MVYVKKKYLRKSECLDAARITVNILGLNMDLKECAQEIFAHVWIYYHVPLKWARRHADPIDLQDGGDTWCRKMVYRVIWRLF